MDEEYKVYKYTNTYNGKVYIGQTKNSLPERAQSNGINYKECRRFYNAIKKYGWHAFRGEIILDGLSLDEANTWEQFYIKSYNSTDAAHGYNISDGGGQREMSDETRRIISLKAKERYQDPSRNPMFGRRHSAGSRKRMSECKRGTSNPMYGRSWTETQKQKCGTNGKKLNLSEERRAEMSRRAVELGRSRARGVRCIEGGLTFASMTKAAEYYHVSPSTLCGQIKRYQKTCRGRHFEYVS